MLILGQTTFNVFSMPESFGPNDVMIRQDYQKACVNELAFCDIPDDPMCYTRHRRKSRSPVVLRADQSAEYAVRLRRVRCLGGHLETF